MQLLYDEARTLASVLGVTAALVIPHGYRIRPEKRREVNDGASSASLNRYRWILTQPDPREYLFWSPHFHLVGWGYLKDSKDFNRDTGWIYIKHKNRPLADIEPTIYYLLSHAWSFGPGKNAYRYWEGLSPSKLTVTEEITWQPEPCRVCGRPMRRVPLTGLLPDGTQAPLYQDVTLAPVSMLKNVTRRYYVRKGKKRIGASGLITSSWMDEDRGK